MWIWTLCLFNCSLLLNKKVSTNNVAPGTYFRRQPLNAFIFLTSCSCGVTDGAHSSSVCVVLSPPVVGCSLLPARQLCLLQICEQQSSARRAPPAVEARGVLLHPLWAAGSRVHRRGRINASLLQTQLNTKTERIDVVKIHLIVHFIETWLLKYGQYSFNSM